MIHVEDLCDELRTQNIAVDGLELAVVLSEFYKGRTYYVADGDRSLVALWVRDDYNYETSQVPESRLQLELAIPEEAAKRGLKKERRLVVYSGDAGLDDDVAACVRNSLAPAEASVHRRLLYGDAPGLPWITIEGWLQLSPAPDAPKPSFPGRRAFPYLLEVTYQPSSSKALMEYRKDREALDAALFLNAVLADGISLGGSSARQIWVDVDSEPRFVRERQSRPTVSDTPTFAVSPGQPLTVDDASYYGLAGRTSGHVSGSLWRRGALFRQLSADDARAFRAASAFLMRGEELLDHSRTLALQCFAQAIESVAQAHSRTCLSCHAPFFSAGKSFAATWDAALEKLPDAFLENHAHIKASAVYSVRSDFAHGSRAAVEEFSPWRTSYHPDWRFEDLALSAARSVARKALCVWLLAKEAGGNTEAPVWREKARKKALAKQLSLKVGEVERVLKAADVQLRGEWPTSSTTPAVSHQGLVSFARGGGVLLAAAVGWWLWRRRQR